MSNKIYRDVNDHEVYSIVKESILDCMLEQGYTEGVYYHCNTAYSNVPSILKFGLLSKKLRKKTFFEEELKQLCIANPNLSADDINKFGEENNWGELTLEEKRIADTHWANGYEYISVGTMNPEVSFSRMYDDEIIYNSFESTGADILIGKVKAGITITENYFNETLIKDRVSPDDFLGINVRVLRAIDEIHDNTLLNSEEKARKILTVYNDFKEMTTALIHTNSERCEHNKSGLYLIEDSGREILSDERLQKGEVHSDLGTYFLDTDKVLETPKIYVK